jgi:hypothetical protein
MPIHTQSAIRQKRPNQGPSPDAYHDIAKDPESRTQKPKRN